MKRLILLVLVISLMVIAMVLVAQNNPTQESVDLRSQDGIWVVPLSETSPITWEVPQQIILIDDGGHTLAGTYYRAELDGTVYLACALGRNGSGVMRLAVREDMSAPCN